MAAAAPNYTLSSELATVGSERGYADEGGNLAVNQLALLG